jgi:hypothetical protein
LIIIELAFDWLIKGILWLFTQVVAGGSNWLDHRATSIDSDSHGRHASTVKARIRVADGTCAGLGTEWQLRQVEFDAGRMRLRRRFGRGVTLPALRAYRLDGDLLGVRVPGADLELAVPRDRQEWLLKRLGYQNPAPAVPPP